MYRHLQPRALCQIAERLDALDGHPRSFVAGPAIELDAQKSALAGLRSRFKRGRRIVVEGGRNELAGAVAQGRHHVAAAPRRSAPARVLDEPGHRRAEALALRNPHLRDLGERPHFVRREQVLGSIDRVRREIEAERVTLCRHALRQGP